MEIVTIYPELTPEEIAWEAEIEMTDRALEIVDAFFDRVDIPAPEIDYEAITVTGDVVTIPLKGWGEMITYNDLTKECFLIPCSDEVGTM